MSKWILTNQVQNDGLSNQKHQLWSLMEISLRRALDILSLIKHREWELIPTKTNPSHFQLGTLSLLRNLTHNPNTLKPPIEGQLHWRID